VSEPTALQDLLSDFYDRADPSLDWLAYVRREELATQAIYPFAGMMAVTRVRFFAGRRFDFDDDGIPAAVIGACGADAETIEDLVAWPLSQPMKFATALGRARGLGVDQARNPASFFGGKPLQVWRTPLGWLRAGCRGVVVLDQGAAALWLGDALGPVAGEDLEHAREIGRLLHPYVDPHRVLFPVRAAA
jgi:hypothetical protein